MAMRKFSELQDLIDHAPMKRSLHHGSPLFHFSFRFLGRCRFHSVNRSPSCTRRLSPRSSKPQPQASGLRSHSNSSSPRSVERHLTRRSARSPTSPASDAAAPSLTTPSSAGLRRRDRRYEPICHGHGRRWSKSTHIVSSTPAREVDEVDEIEASLPALTSTTSVLCPPAYHPRRRTRGCCYIPGRT